MNTNVSVLFYVKRSKVNAKGFCPVYVRVTVNSKRFEFSSNKFAHLDKWSSEAGRIRSNSEEARSINSSLDNIKNKILNAEKTLLKKDIEINSENLKNEVFGISTIRERMLIPIFQDHNSKVKELVGHEYSPGTLQRYETSLKHTQDFMQWKLNISDIGISKVDHAFITEYEFYLRSVRKCANNTAVKYIKNFKKIIRICLANGWIDKDPFVNYKAKVKEVIRHYLTEEEIQTIIDKEFVSERLELVRDIFIFSCFTGLAYIDVKQLTRSHISFGIDGDKWIFTTRQKTETISKIPLLPRAQSIVAKYESYSCNEGNLLPILSNQKMNAY